MDDDRTFEDQTYTGFWINRAKGSTYGATLTMHRQAGNFLIAFLAMYVAMTGQSFWTISRYLLHGFLSTNSPSDGIYHQHQAILRNSRTAPQAAQETMRLMIAWRKRGARLFVRLLPIWLSAFLVSASFAVAGIFSSQVTANQSNEVLLRGDGCAISNNNSEYNDKGYKFFYDAAIENFNYAYTCYQGNGEKRSTCQRYTATRLKYESDRNASCPFDSSICQKSSENILLDTGNLDSWSDLGINVEPRFQLRIKQHCAPLITDGYSFPYANESDPSREFMIYSYLRNYSYTNSSYTRIENNYNIMIPLRTDSEESIRSWSDSIRPDYRTSAIFISPEISEFFIPELTRTNAIVSLLFIDSTDIRYAHRNEDPVFAANIFDSEVESYYPDEPVTVIGCATEAYYCNPKISGDDRGCIDYWSPNVTSLFTDEDDSLAFQAYTDSPTSITPDELYQLPGLPNLLARATAKAGWQSKALPRDHWKAEMEYLMQTSLASVQSNMPKVSQYGTYLLNRTTCGNGTKPELCDRLCQNQKVRSSEFFSFNVLGVAIIIFIGLFLMLIAAYIETIAISISNILKPDRRRYTPYSRLEWDSNSYLDLQRLANQALGLGSWSRSRTGVPITAPGERLGVIGTDESSKLPVLKQTTTAKELQDMAGSSRHQHDYPGDSGDTAHLISTPDLTSGQSRKTPELRVTSRDSGSESSFESRYLHRPGYERAHTDDPDAMHRREP